MYFLFHKSWHTRVGEDTCSWCLETSSHLGSAQLTSTVWASRLHWLFWKRRKGAQGSPGDAEFSSSRAEGVLLAVRAGVPPRGSGRWTGKYTRSQGAEAPELDPGQERVGTIWQIEKEKRVLSNENLTREDLEWRWNMCLTQCSCSHVLAPPP